MKVMEKICIHLKREYGYDRWRFVAMIQPEGKPVIVITSPAILDYESGVMTNPALQVLAGSTVYALRVNLADFSPPPCDCQHGYKVCKVGENFVGTSCPKDECADYARRVLFVPLGPIEVTAEDPHLAKDLEILISERIDHNKSGV